MKRLSFYVDKEIHYVTIERTKNKNMYLKVKGDDIIISAPRLASERTIQRFVSLHIKKFVQYVKNKKEFQLYSVSLSYIFINGKKEKFSVITGFKKNQLINKNSKVYIETMTGSDEEVEKAVKDYLKKWLLIYIEKQQPYYEKDMKIPHHDIKVTYKTSSWGTNMIGRNRISYSSKLAHFGNEVIDYVIVHELSHYKEANHSKSFWKIVEEIIPNYKIIRNKLKADICLE